MVDEIVDLKTIEVTTETEALMLENSLIKSLRPKYNIMLRDDKTFPFVRVSREKFPCFTIVRKVKNDKARYFGPFITATYLRVLLQLAQNLYGVRLYSDQSYESRSSLPNQIGLGARNIDSEEDYAVNVENAIKFISAPQPEMERTLSAAMKEAAAHQQFEKAAIFRNRLQALQELRNNQSLFSASFKKRDYLGISTVGSSASAYILCEREGKITNSYHYLFSVPSIENPSELTEWIIRYLFVNALPVPNEIVTEHTPFEDTQLREDIKFSSGLAPKFVMPQRGEVKARLDRAQENAAYQLKLESMKKTRRTEALGSLAQILNLKNIPRRIEAFDISNLGATNIVGASIVFIDGQPAKNEYRKYKIETPQGQDDFASMRELVFRRLVNKDRDLPDLMLIDGGKGQLSAAQDAMKRAKVEVAMISLAKKEELIYLPNQSEPVVIKHDNPTLLLLTAIRDEVHRFVIRFHRDRRGRITLKD